MANQAEKRTLDDESLPELLSPNQVATLLNVSRGIVNKWFSHGLLTGGTLPGGRRRIHRVSVQKIARDIPNRRGTACAKLPENILIATQDGKLVKGIQANLPAGNPVQLVQVSHQFELGFTLQERTFRALLVDYRFPLGRIEYFIKKIRSSFAGRRIKIVILVCELSHHESDSLLRAGANMVIYTNSLTSEDVRASVSWS